MKDDTLDMMLEFLEKEIEKEMVQKLGSFVEFLTPALLREAVMRGTSSLEGLLVAGFAQDVCSIQESIKAALGSFETNATKKMHVDSFVLLTRSIVMKVSARVFTIHKERCLTELKKKAYGLDKPKAAAETKPEEKDLGLH